MTDECLSPTNSGDEEGNRNDMALVVAVAEHSQEGCMDLAKYGFNMGEKCWGYLKRYRRGEISGKLCAMKCAKHLIKGLGRVGGAGLGAATGSVVGGPISMILAGIGWNIAGKLADTLAKKLEARFFKSDDRTNIKEAYNFLEISEHATDEEVRHAFRKKALLYYPERREDGNAELWHKLTVAKALIKLERGTDSGAQTTEKIHSQLAVRK